MSEANWKSRCRVGAEYRDISGEGGREGARRCVEKLMRETSGPHFVNETTVNDGEMHLWPFYVVVSNSHRNCGNGTEYSNPFEGNNEDYARECAEALNFLNKLAGRAERYAVKLTRSLPILADSFRVVVNSKLAPK